MRRMIRIMMILLTLFCCVRGFAQHCCAETDSLFESLAPDGIPVPDAVTEQMDAAGLSPDDPDAFGNLSPSEFIGSLRETVLHEASAPLRLLGALLSLTVLSALLRGTGDAVSAHLHQFPVLICTLICTGLAGQPLCDALRRAASALEDGRLFMLGFVPVFSGFLAAGGSPGGAVSYQVLVLFLCEGVMQLLGAVLLPVLQMSAALGTVDAVNPELRLGGTVSFLRTAVTWTLGTVMALFSALLSIRSFVAAAADSMASKTVKLLSSGLIPIVGGAVSDAYGTVQGSIRLVRSGVGAFGMTALLWLTLPPLISVTLYRVIFAVSGICADMLDVKPMSALFRNAGTVLAAASAMLICFAVMLIFATAIMLLLMN